MVLVYFVFPPETTNISSRVALAGLIRSSTGSADRAEGLSQPRLIQQYGDAVACEATGFAASACADGRLSVRPALDLLEKIVGKFAQICDFKTDYVQCGGACEAAIHVACFARVRRDIRSRQAIHLKQRDYFFFLLLQAEGLDRPRKILHGEEAAAPSHRCNAHGGDVGIEYVFPVAGGVHPSVMNGLRIGTDSDVLRNHGEYRAGPSGTLVQGRLIQALMQEQILTYHHLGVPACGCGKCVIPLERLQSGGGTLLVSGVEKEFLLG
jgi:hypothetical protein